MSNGEGSEALRQLTVGTWVVVLVGGFLSMLVGEDGPERVHHLGGVLQVAGAVAVAGEVYLLQHPNESIGVVARRLRKRLARWVRRLLGLRQNQTVHLGSASSTVAASSVSAEGHRRSSVWSQTPPDDVREGIERLEVMVRDLDRLLGDERNRRSERDRAEAKARADAITTLRQELTESITAVEQRLTEAARRPIRLRWQGVFLLILGIVLAAWPGAIAQGTGWTFNALFGLPSWTLAVGLFVAFFLGLRLRYTR